MNLIATCFRKLFQKIVSEMRFYWLPPPRGGATPRKIVWESVARFPKPLPYLKPTSAIFPSLFMA